MFAGIPHAVYCCNNYIYRPAPINRPNYGSSRQLRRSWIQAENVPNAKLSYSLPLRVNHKQYLICISTVLRGNDIKWDTLHDITFKHSDRKIYRITNREFESLEEMLGTYIWEGESWPFSPKHWKNIWSTTVDPNHSGLLLLTFNLMLLQGRIMPVVKHAQVDLEAARSTNQWSYKLILGFITCTYMYIHGQPVCITYNYHWVNIYALQSNRNSLILSPCTPEDHGLCMHDWVPLELAKVVMLQSLYLHSNLLTSPVHC